MGCESRVNEEISGGGVGCDSGESGAKTIKEVRTSASSGGRVGWCIEDLWM